MAHSQAELEHDVHATIDAGAPAHGHDSHGHPVDPNAAPLRQDVTADFATVHYIIAGLLGGGAIVLGTIFGLLLVND